MFEVMLIGLLVLVLILIPLCIGFVVIVRMDHAPDAPGFQTDPGYCGGAIASSGAMEKGWSDKILTAEDTFAFEMSESWGSFRKGLRTSVARGGCCGDAPNNTDKAVLQDQLKDSMMFRYAVVAGIALLF